MEMPLLDLPRSESCFHSGNFLRSSQVTSSDTRQSSPAMNARMVPAWANRRSSFCNSMRSEPPAPLEPYPWMSLTAAHRCCRAAWSSCSIRRRACSTVGMPSSTLPTFIYAGLRDTGVTLPLMNRDDTESGDREIGTSGDLKTRAQRFCKSVIFVMPFRSPDRKITRFLSFGLLLTVAKYEYETDC